MYKSRYNMPFWYWSESLCFFAKLQWRNNYKMRKLGTKRTNFGRSLLDFTNSDRLLQLCVAFSFHWIIFCTEIWLWILSPSIALYWNCCKKWSCCGRPSMYLTGQVQISVRLKICGYTWEDETVLSSLYNLTGFE